MGKTRRVSFSTKRRRGGRRRKTKRRGGRRRSRVKRRGGRRRSRVKRRGGGHVAYCPAFDSEQYKPAYTKKMLGKQCTRTNNIDKYTHVCPSF